MLNQDILAAYDQRLQEQCKREPVLLLSITFKALREFLWGKGFVEFPVPAIRASDGCSAASRIRLEDGRFLHDSPALALRRHLHSFPRVFSISQCYRADEIDNSHLQQFFMLDLYAQDNDLSDIVDLFKQLVALVYAGPIEYLSISEVIKSEFNVCLTSQADCIERLSQKLTYRFGDRGAAIGDLLDRWFLEEIEPLSRNKCMIVSDFPCLTEARAKPRSGTIAIADRVEFQIHGYEVAHLYQDDPDVEALVRRAKDFGHHGKEDDVISALITSGKVPRSSAGGAIGLERLCAASLGMKSIIDFLPAPEFVSQIDIMPKYQSAAALPPNTDFR